MVVEAHRHPGVFIARGKEDALVTLNSTPGKDVYGEKRIQVEGTGGNILCDTMCMCVLLPLSPSSTIIHHSQFSPIHTSYTMHYIPNIPHTLHTPQPMHHNPYHTPPQTLSQAPLVPMAPP